MGKNRNHETCKPRKFSAIRYSRGDPGFTRGGCILNDFSCIGLIWSLTPLDPQLYRADMVPSPWIHYRADMVPPPWIHHCIGLIWSLPPWIHHCIGLIHHCIGLIWSLPPGCRADMVPPPWIHHCIGVIWSLPPGSITV